MEIECIFKTYYAPFDSTCRFVIYYTGFNLLENKEILTTNIYLKID